MKVKSSCLAKKLKIKLKNTKKQPLLYILFAIFPIALGAFAAKKTNNIPFIFQQPEIVNKGTNLKLTELADIDSLEKLVPTTTISEFLVENSQKTALLIPQNHKYPGSKPADKINNSAQNAQQQIYEIISRLHKDYGIDFIMAEGELFGPVEDKKIAGIDRKIEKRDQFATEVKEIEVLMKKENIDRQVIENFSKSASAYLDHLDREIILEGAPYVYVAKENCDDIEIYGAENEQTRNESKAIVQDYIYEKDRLSQLSGTSKSLRSSILGNSFSLGLSTQTETSSLERTMDEAENQAMSCGNDSLAKKIDLAQQDYRDLEKLDEESTGDPDNSNLPKRTENPYANINDPEKLKEEMRQTEAKIQQVVIDRRNLETARYFNDALENNGKQTGIIQYGAGHEQGLIEQLNKLGISVIVIKPDEVARREKMDGNEELLERGSGNNSAQIETRKEDLLKKLEQLKNSEPAEDDFSSKLELLKKHLEN